MADVSINDLRKKIKEILKDADLSTLSAKKVRIKLQSAFETDLSSRKKEIDKLTMSLILEMEEKKKEESDGEDEEEAEAGKNGDSVKEEQNGKKKKSDSEEEPEKEPPKKKSKSKSSSSSSKKKKAKHRDDDDDADIEPLENDDLNVYDEEQKTLKLTDEELAQRLQQFEQTGRRTRNKAAPPKKKSEKRKGPTNSNYTKPCELSPQLAKLMGTDRLPRHEVMKKMWDIVKEKKLQDPKDKRFMLCDEEMMTLFGRKRVQLFGMMKYLTSHIRGDNPTIESVITNSDIYDDEADEADDD